MQPTLAVGAEGDAKVGVGDKDAAMPGAEAGGSWYLVVSVRSASQREF
jgi:hypothetical protein